MFAQVNGTRLYHRIRGRGTPMVMMHGGPGLDHTYFLPWFDRLCGHMEIIYYDHRGNGRSEGLDGLASVTHDTWIDDADALRRQLGYDRIVLFGHSYGGALALEYALKYGEHLAGLILCCTAPAFDYLDVILENAKARGTAEQLEALGAVLSGTLTEDAQWRKMWITYLPLYFKEYDPAVGAAMDEKTVYRVAPQNHANAFCLPSFNVLDRLHKITAPALVLSGKEDWITPHAQAGERIQAGLPHAESVLFEDSGHFPFIEETDLFMRRIADWAAGLDTSAGRACATGPVRAGEVS